MSQTIVILFCQTYMYSYFNHLCVIHAVDSTLADTKHGATEFALLQPKRNEEHGLSLLHSHFINLRIFSGAGSSPRRTVTGDKVWVAYI